MRLHLWGVDFRRGYSKLQRRLYIPIPKRAEAIEDLRRLGFGDLVYLATCHRIEFYTSAPDPFSDLSGQWKKLLRQFGLGDEALYDGYHLEGKGALRHLLRVASSLESMTIGEPQILGQLKDALQFASTHQHISVELGYYFQLAFETAKVVRSETDIGKNRVSLVNLAFDRVESLKNEFPLKKAAVVGGGEMGQRFVEWLRKEYPQTPILWVNRSLEKIQNHSLSAECETIRLSDFLSKDFGCTHLFTATTSEQPIFNQSFFDNKLNAKCLAFDFAEPRDIDEIATHPNLTIVKIQDLKQEAVKNALERQAACREAEQIISEKMRDFFMQHKEAPVLKKFQELEPQFRSCFDGEQLDVNSFISKTFHLCREHVRRILRESVLSNESSTIP